MKQLKWILVALVAVATGLVILINATSLSPDDEPMPDRSMVIELPSGEEKTLGELVDALAPVAETGSGEAPEPVAGGSPQQGAVIAPKKGDLLQQFLANEDGSLDLIGLAEVKLEEGEPEVAIALLRSVPKDHPRYAKARRRLGWDVYTKGLGEPARGVAHVNASLMSDPFSGNAWQDASRVYLNKLGLPVR